MKTTLYFTTPQTYSIHTLTLVTFQSQVNMQTEAKLTAVSLVTLSVLNRRAYKTMGNFLRCQKALDAQSQLYSDNLSHISTYISCPREVQLSKQTHKT